MARHKQALKRHRQNLKRRERNRSVITNLRGVVKKARASIATGKPDEATLKAATKAFDRAVSKGALKKRTASRRISRLARAANRVQS